MDDESDSNYRRLGVAPTSRTKDRTSSSNPSISYWAGFSVPRYYKFKVLRASTFSRRLKRPYREAGVPQQPWRLFTEWTAAFTLAPGRTRQGEFQNPGQVFSNTSGPCILNIKITTNHNQCAASPSNASCVKQRGGRNRCALNHIQYVFAPHCLRFHSILIFGVRTNADPQH